MFRQILVATDLTRGSNAALDRADTLAREERAHLHILHVARDPAREPWVVEADGIDWERLRAEACGKGHRALVGATRRLGRDPRTTTLWQKLARPQTRFSRTPRAMPSTSS